MERSGGGSRGPAVSVRAGAAVGDRSVGGVAQRSLVALVILVDCGAARKERIKICRRNKSIRLKEKDSVLLRLALFTLIWLLGAEVTSIPPHDQTLTLTCAALTVNGRGRLSRRGHAVPMLHQDSGGWLGAAVMMQGGSHLGGHASERGAALRRTHAAVLVTSWSTRV